MAAVSSEFPIEVVFEIAGPLVTARCTSVCRTWRAATEKTHVWRMHLETTCARLVATVLEELQREGRTSLTFKELIIKRRRSTNGAVASAYTWTQATLVHRQTGVRMDFVSVRMDETHRRRLFTRSGVPSEASGLPLPSFALSEVESIKDCSIVLTLYDLAEARVAKITTAHFVEPPSSEMAYNAVRNFMFYNIETVVGEMTWARGATTGDLRSVAVEVVPDLGADETRDMMIEMIIDALIETIMEDPLDHHTTLRLHPVLVVAENPPSIRLRIQFMYWEDEGDGVVQSSIPDKCGGSWTDFWLSRLCGCEGFNHRSRIEPKLDVNLVISLGEAHQC